MNKICNSLFIFLLFITCIITPQEKNIQKRKYSLRSISYKLNDAWHNKWVKVGSITTACALLYLCNLRFNFLALPLAALTNSVASSEINKKEEDKQHNDTLIESSTPTESSTISSPIKNDKNKVVSSVKNSMIRMMNWFNDSIITEE